MTKGAEGKEDGILDGLVSEADLTPEEARAYISLLRDGSVPAARQTAETSKLMALGMAILSGDGRSVVPVHPRLGIANQYRTWRERVVKEVNDRRMRTDRLILELIPLYETAEGRRRLSQGKG